MQRVLIIVEKALLHPAGTFKIIYRNELSYPLGVNIPFDGIYKGLKLLYPSDDIYITFKLF